MHVLLREPEVNEKQAVTVLIVAYREVLGLHVAVDVVGAVQVLQNLHQLHADHKHGLQREVAGLVADLQGFEVRAQQRHYNVAEVRLRLELNQTRKSWQQAQVLHDLLLLLKEVRGLAVFLLDLDGVEGVALSVDHLVDFAERALPYLLLDLVAPVQFVVDQLNSLDGQIGVYQSFAHRKKIDRG